jgi:hypothetical protein
MNKAFLLVAAISSGVVVAPSPAVAGKSDDAWAGCLWEQVPTSAANWLKLPAPKRDYGLSDVPPEYVLQFRLQAACFDTMTPAGKTRPPSFNAKAVRKSLELIKPAAISEDKSDPKAYRCSRYFLNDTELKTPAGFDWGFGDDTSKAQFMSISYFFAAEKGGAVGLPDQGGIRKCSYINSDGSFEDAQG